MLSAMTAPQARATQTPNHTILILTSPNFSQLAKSIEEWAHRTDSDPQRETIAQIFKSENRSVRRWSGDNKK
jgi:hypothetical protein